jgi:hypothetical protein
MSDRSHTAGGFFPARVGENVGMTATLTTDNVKERLASCPVCKADVLADAYAVLRQGEWYHLRCAIERDEHEGRHSEVEELRAPRLG